MTDRNYDRYDPSDYDPEVLTIARTLGDAGRAANGFRTIALVLRPQRELDALQLFTCREAVPDTPKIGRFGADDRDRIHDHLREVSLALDRLFAEGYELLAIDSYDDDDARDDIYSDGSPVFSTVRPAGEFPSPETAVYSGDLGRDLAAGTGVIVTPPPHLR